MFKDITVISAVPGSGKTTFMINEAYRLLTEEDYQWEDIAFITFTKNAAETAKDRMTAKFLEGRGHIGNSGKNSKKLSGFSTLHAMAFHALGLHREDMIGGEEHKAFNMLYGYRYYRNDKESITHGGCPVHHDTRTVKQDNGTLLEYLAGLYRNNKNTYVDVMNSPNMKRSALGNEVVMTYIARWELFKKGKMLDSNNHVYDIKAVVGLMDGEFNGYEFRGRMYDFTDILEEYVDKGLTEDGRRAVFIDEAQDITTLQWKVLFHAFKNAERVYIVADPKQNMFKWAGSDVDMFLNMKATRTHNLYKNYRCRSNIIDFINYRIIRYITQADKLDMPMEPVHEGGEVHTVHSLNEFLDKEGKDSIVDPHKKIMMLATTSSIATRYRDWCQYWAIPYVWMGIPVFSNKDKQDYMKCGGIPTHWDVEKQRAAASYHSAGTLMAEPTVYINTMHTVKGDEADIVIINPEMSKVGYEEYTYDAYQTDLVFYVGCTRAKHKLYIYKDAARMGGRMYTRL